MTRIGKGGHKEIKFCSLKNCTVNGYEKVWVKLSFLIMKILVM